MPCFRCVWIIVLSLPLAVCAADRGDRRNSGPRSPFPRFITSTDVRIGDPTVSYKDQEFLTDQHLMVWQDADEGVWVCRYDVRTGELNPSDGRGQFIAKAAPLLTPDVFLKTVINGPEFGISRRGIGIYFCLGDDPPNYQVARVDLTDGTLEIIAPDRTNGVRGALASLDQHAAACRVLYGRLATAADGTLTVISEWFEEGHPDSLEEFPHSALGTTGPRWIPHHRAILTNVYDAAGVPQIARYDIDSRKTTFLTTGPNAKVDAISFEAPEYPGEQIFLCLVDGRWIGVYRQHGRGWNCIRRIFAPATLNTGEPSTVTSAEPVIYRGETFFTYVATAGDDSTRICLASLDGRINAAISTPSSLRHLDPEGVPAGDKLFVYYWTTRNADGVNELRLCKVRVWP